MCSTSPAIEGGMRANEDFAAKRDRIYLSRRDSLRREIDSLRSFLMSMAKDQELLRKQAQAEHILYQKRLSSTEKELWDTQCRLKETQNEAASLLESKHMEMVKLQNERDYAFMMFDSLCQESGFLKDYGNSLEQKISTLEQMLLEYHLELEKKSESVLHAETFSSVQWDYLQENMATFASQLLELQNTNDQLSLEKEYYLKELHNLKQSLDKSNAGLVDAERKLSFATHIIEDLQERLQRLERDFQNANQKAEFSSAQLNAADATILQLQRQVQKLRGQLDALQEKHSIMLKEKLEADVAAESREATLSELTFRISALEDDLQKERFLRLYKLPDSLLGRLTEFSSAFEKSKRTRIHAIKGASGSDYIERNLNTMKKLYEQSGTINQQEIHHTNLDVGLQTDEMVCNPWNIEKIKKLEQTLTEAHRQYGLLHEEQVVIAEANEIIAVAEDKPNMRLQGDPYVSDEESTVSEISAIVDQFLGKTNCTDAANLTAVKD